jgi:hypothetical protein
MLFANFAHSEEPYVPKDNEEYYGTWINEKYDSKPTWAKWVINPDGTWASYGKSTSEDSLKGEGPYTITAKWTDDKGYVWYKITWKNSLWGTSGYGLICISDSSVKMEAAYAASDYPEKIDSTLSFWQYGGIHYREGTYPR